MLWELWSHPPKNNRNRCLKEKWCDGYLLKFSSITSNITWLPSGQSKTSNHSGLKLIKKVSFYKIASGWMRMYKQVRNGFNGNFVKWDFFWWFLYTVLTSNFGLDFCHCHGDVVKKITKWLVLAPDFHEPFVTIADQRLGHQVKKRSKHNW